MTDSTSAVDVVERLDAINREIISSDGGECEHTRLTREVLELAVRLRTALATAEREIERLRRLGTLWKDSGERP